MKPHQTNIKHKRKKKKKKENVRKSPGDAPETPQYYALKIYDASTMSINSYENGL